MLGDDRGGRRLVPPQSISGHAIRDRLHLGFRSDALELRRVSALRPPGRGPAVAFPSHVTLVISIINREVPSCELPASCLWSSRCWLSPVLLRASRAPSPTSAG